MEDSTGVDDKALTVAKVEFTTAIKLADHYMKDMSAKEIRRALVASLIHDIDESRVRFVQKMEPKLAAILAKAIDMKIILKAYNYKQSEEEKEKENVISEENNELAGTGDTTVESGPIGQ